MSLDQAHAEALAGIHPSCKIFLRAREVQDGSRVRFNRLPCAEGRDRARGCIPSADAARSPSDQLSAAGTSVRRGRGDRAPLRSQPLTPRGAAKVALRSRLS